MSFSPKYSLLNIIGAGSFGTVRKCEHRRSHQTYAAKISKDERHMQELQHEIEVLKRIQNKYCVKLVESFVETKRIVLILELCSTTLYDFLTERPASRGTSRKPKLLPVLKAVPIAVQLLVGLDYLHKNSIYHLDVKPINIGFVKKNVKIFDFTGAVSSNAWLTRRTGTVLYRAPEIDDENPRYRPNKADVFSCAVVIYEMITGNFPHTWKSVGNVHRRKWDFAASPEFKKMLQTGLSAKPTERFTAVAFLNEMEKMK